MKKYKLDKYEQETLDAVEKVIENGNYEGSLTPERKKELQEIARESLQKNKSINIRLSGADLMKLKQKAYDNGLPYQTIVSTLIHKYNQGKIKLEL